MTRLDQRHVLFRFSLMAALFAMPAVAGSEAGEAADAEQLQSYLKSRGWHMERDDQGSILLTPLAQEANARAGTGHERPSPTATGERPAPSAPCADDSRALAKALTAGVELPVDTNRKAWQISVNWLWESGFTQLRVGRIQRLDWVYRVIIVDATTPYRPRGELLIHQRTGALLASL